MEYQREEILQGLRENSNKRIFLALEYYAYQVGFITSGIIGARTYLDNSHWLLPQMDTIGLASASIANCIAIHKTCEHILRNFDLEGRLSKIDMEKNTLLEELRKTLH